jgi:hypothetical protein
MITIGDDGMPQFVIQPGVEYDGSSRFEAPQLGGGPFVVFYAKALPQGLASLEAGRPIHKSVLFIKIQHPGERDNVDRIAEAGDALKYRAQYMAYCQDRKADGIIGTPLSTIFPAHPDIVETLRFHKVYTVEQLAELPDTAMQNIGMGGQEYRDKAKRYLGAAASGKGFAYLEAQVEKLQKAQERIDADRALLQNENQRLRSQLEALQAAQQGGMMGQAPQRAFLPPAPQPFIDADAGLSQVMPEPMASPMPEPQGFTVGLDDPLLDTPEPAPQIKRQHVLKKKGE